jgi:hypothetical protein
MDQTLSLYVIETLPLLDATSPAYALDVLTLVESILENPELILRRQLDRIRDRAIAEMKAEGMEFEQRMEELDKLEYPRPLRDFVYETFNAFADRHPWVGEENIRPKSIAREMFEQYRSFAEYVLEYELQRSEGLLLRHLNSVYKVLSQTVPDIAKTPDVLEMELYLRTMLRAVDSSLEDEWERMRNPASQRPSDRQAGESIRPPGASDTSDITRDRSSFVAAIRTRIFTFLRAWTSGDYDGALAASFDARVSGQPAEAGEAITPPSWTTERLKVLAEEYRVDHGYLRLDPEARNLRHTHVIERNGERVWRVQQVLVDNEGHNDWMAEFDVDLAVSAYDRTPGMALVSLGEIG